MGFVIEDKRRARLLLHPIHLRGDEMDRFGLPLLWEGLLESPEKRKARIEAAKCLAKDAFETVARHLGHDEARHLFATISKKPPKGKQPKQNENKNLLELYDQEVNATPDLVKSVPGILAGRLFPENSNSARSTEKRIRRLVKKRDDAKRVHEEKMKMFRPTLFELAIAPSCKEDL
jgi:hypothetical protein